MSSPGYFMFTGVALWWNFPMVADRRGHTSEVMCRRLSGQRTREREHRTNHKEDGKEEWITLLCLCFLGFGLHGNPSFSLPGKQYGHQMPIQQKNPHVAQSAHACTAVSFILQTLTCWSSHSSQVQCVTFRRLYRQEWDIIFKSMFPFMYDQQKNPYVFVTWESAFYIGPMYGPFAFFILW